MTAESAAFDGASQQFISHYDQVRGYVRLRVTQHNVAQHLAGSALEVLDYQGGAAHDSIWIASMGENVLLLDESPEMLTAAKVYIKAQPANVRRHIRLLKGNIPELPADKRFDVILSHGVLMYELDNPQGQLNFLADQLKQRGILSLLTKGYVAAQKQVKDSGLPEVDVANHYTNRLKLPARAYNFAELEAMVSLAGLEVIARYGVRLFSDNDRRLWANLAESEISDIMTREIAGSGNEELMEQAQMLQVIARKAVHNNPPVENGDTAEIVV